jgi:hypothetical protein
MKTEIRIIYRAQAPECVCCAFLCQSLSQRAQCSAPTAGERLRGLRGVYLYLRQVDGPNAGSNRT